MKRICSAGLAALVAVALFDLPPAAAEVIRAFPAKEVATASHGQPVALADVPRVAPPIGFAWRATVVTARRAHPASPFTSLTWARALRPIDSQAAAADTLARLLDPFTLLAEPSSTQEYGIMAIEPAPIVGQSAARAIRSAR